MLGDSTAAGLGDPVPGGWRGVGPLLADALSGARPVRLTNLSFTGARMACVRRRQLPEALRLRPDAAVLIAGMNDTMRSDFNQARLRADLAEVVGQLRCAGTAVLTVRFHDHARVFRLPGPLRRALRARIERLNEVLDAVLAEHDVACVDLDQMAGTYHAASWSVDRLHPSELGHRLLAAEFARLLAERGCAVPNPVSLDCSGGVPAGPLARTGWLVFKGLPWLWRRGSDLVPYALGVLLRSLLGAEPATPPAQPAQPARPSLAANAASASASETLVRM